LEEKIPDCEKTETGKQRNSHDKSKAQKGIQKK
jgi:hypothetical protein